MLGYLSKSVLLLFFLIVIVCGIYPLSLWLIGQTFFPFQANGSLLMGSDGKPIGSALIAQPFTKAEFFQPRPSAASYDASASTSSALAASNYALRDRVARSIGPIAKYQTGQLIGPHIEKWFQGKKEIVAKWASKHHALAEAWVTSDPTHTAYVDNWAKSHQAIVAQYIKDNPSNPTPKASDLAVVFFQQFSHDYPGQFPAAKNQVGANDKTEMMIVPVNTGTDIQAIFFDMWLQDHPQVVLKPVPGDFVTTSASGLDPHITLQSALFQLDRIARAWAIKLKRDHKKIAAEIHQLLQKNTQAPFAGLTGEKFVNVLEMNLALTKQWGSA